MSGLERSIRLTDADAFKIAKLFRNYLDPSDAVGKVRDLLEEIYDARPSMQHVIMSTVLEHAENHTGYELTEDFRMVPRGDAVWIRDLGPLIAAALETWDAMPDLKPHLCKTDPPERDRLIEFGFGEPFIDLGNGIGATCVRCKALVVESVAVYGDALVNFREHRQDHSNTDRAIIGAAATGESNV